MPKIFRQLRLFFIAAFPIAVAAYSIWYWGSDHQQLVTWYKSINPFFYKAESWETYFFTEIVKRQGDWWCATALLASVVGAFFCWKTPYSALPKFDLKKQQIFIYAGIALVGVALSLNANFHTIYSADEVFSALNFATLPIFQTLSYYALPNNHPFFNSISGWVDDPVMSGRIISMICYVGVLLFTWYFLKKWPMSNWLRAVLLLVIAFQFPVWGFSGQARGYEMVLLFSCLSFGAFYNYHGTGSKYWLPFHTAFNVAGMLTIPTYLYWWAGLLLASIIFQLSNRRLDWAYIRSSIIGFTITLILYLPLLTFSGLQSITHNKYVKPADTSRGHFLTNLNEQKYFDVLFKEWFCIDHAVVLIGATCIAFPILLFIYKWKNKPHRTLGTIYFSILFAFFGMAVVMLKFPFTRNLIAHGYLTLLIALIALTELFKSKKMQILLALTLLLFAGYSAKQNYKKIPYHLYYYDVAGYIKKVGQYNTDFKTGSTAYLDDDCFYWWYILRKQHPEKKLEIEYNKARFNRQDYCIVPLDSLPPVNAELYQLLETGEEHQIFGKQE